jgi:pseudaminic acid cytidylyltransferase
MTTIAIIPARGGSKRIPRKNIRDFCGKPIIHYSIKAALESGIFDDVIVSTDDDEISEIAKREGASVPFLRSDNNSNDFAGILEVLIEVVAAYEKTTGKILDKVCCILPTAPLIKIDILIKSFQLLNDQHFDSVFPVVSFGYPIQRGLQITNGKAKMFWPENYSKRSQDLPNAYHDVGQFYWIDIKKCFSQHRIFTENSGVIELSEKVVQDIDTEDDWKMAELKYLHFFNA